MNTIGYKAFFKITGLFIVSRSVILFFFLLASNNFSTLTVRETKFHYSDNRILNYLGSWDSGWYIYVANCGYLENPGEEQSNYGFFPLYPAVMKLAGIPFHDNFIGGIIVSNFFLLLAALFLYLLCINIYQDRSTASIAVLILYFFREVTCFQVFFQRRHLLGFH